MLISVIVRRARRRVARRFSISSRPAPFDPAAERAAQSLGHGGIAAAAPVT